MFTQSLTLTQLTVEKLFKEGTCLTFDPRLSPAYCNAINNAPKNVWVKSGIAKLALEKYNPPFHYFSNGVLIHSLYPDDNINLKFKRIEKILFSKGYEIKKVYGPQTPIEHFAYDSFLRSISTIAILKYSVDESIEYESIPDKKTFVENCFKNGNLLLTASESEKYRKCLAFFENGDFFVSDQYRIGSLVYDPNLPHNFKYNGKYEVYLPVRYVPQEYIDSLYANFKTTQKRNRKSKEMTSYIKNLIKNRLCISITYPTDIKYYDRPDRDFYVLFDDGKLILSNDMNKTFNEYIIDLLKMMYPNLEFDAEYVPEYYIANIYDKLSKVQKTAKEIYIESLIQKAKDLEKNMSISQEEALDLCSKMSGFKSFNEAIQINEDNARYAIYIQNRKN